MDVGLAARELDRCGEPLRLVGRGHRRHVLAAGVAPAELCRDHRLEAVFEVPDRRRASERALEHVDKTVVVAFADKAGLVHRGRRFETGCRIRVVAECIHDRTRPAARAVRGADRAQKCLRCVPGRRRVEDGDAFAVQCVVAASEQRFVLLRRSAPVRTRVRLVPDDDSVCVGDSVECALRIATEARLFCWRRRRVAGETGDREDDARALRSLLGTCELGGHRPRQPQLAFPRHPDPDRLDAERLLPSNDAEWVGRPLQRVVVDTDEQARMLRPRPQFEPRADCQRSDDPDDDQSLRDATPRNDCFSTRNPVATTVRR